MNTDTIDKTSDVWWAENGDEVCRKAMAWVDRLNSGPVVHRMVCEVSVLQARALSRYTFSQDVIANARHDLCVLAGMMDDSQ